MGAWCMRRENEYEELRKALARVEGATSSRKSRAGTRTRSWLSAPSSERPEMGTKAAPAEVETATGKGENPNPWQYQHQSHTGDDIPLCPDRSKPGPTPAWYGWWTD